MGPIAKIINPELGTQIETTQVALPFLLANPTAVQHVTNAANFLGATYQHIVNQLYQSFSACGDCTQQCIDNASVAIATKLNDLNGNVDIIAQEAKADFFTACNTAVSAAYNLLDHCANTINAAAEALQPGTCLEVKNTIPPKPNDWSGSIDWQQFISFIPAVYYLNSSGSVIKGTRINVDGTLTLADNSLFRITNETDPVAVLQFIQSVDDDSPPLTCVVDSFVPPATCGPGTSGGGTTTGGGTTGGTTTGGTVGGQSQTCPDGSIIPLSQSCPQPVTVTNPECCPPQQIIVPAPIVNVTVQSAVCPAPAATTAESPATEAALIESVIAATGAIEPLTWEPLITDYIEQVMDELGFPKDFSDYFGAYVKNTANDLINNQIRNINDFADVGGNV